MIDTEFAAYCDNCGHRIRDESRIGDEHTSVWCGEGRPGTFKEL